MRTTLFSLSLSLSLSLSPYRKHCRIRLLKEQQKRKISPIGLYNFQNYIVNDEKEKERERERKNDLSFVQ